MNETVPFYLRIYFSLLYNRDYLFQKLKGQVKFEKKLLLFLLLSATYLIILSHALIKTQNLSLKTTFHMPERNTFSTYTYILNCQ